MKILEQIVPLKTRMTFENYRAWFEKEGMPIYRLKVFNHPEPIIIVNIKKVRLNIIERTIGALWNKFIWENKFSTKPWPAEVVVIDTFSKTRTLYFFKGDYQVLLRLFEKKHNATDKEIMDLGFEYIGIKICDYTATGI